MSSVLSGFKLTQYRFFLEVTSPISLPAYKGSTLRGAFGHAFKRIVCVSRQSDCETCLLKGKCAYSYIFETPPAADTEKMRKYTHAPHPFVLTPPLESKTLYREGEPIAFDLVLIGRGIEYLPYFIYTFDELGRRGIGRGNGTFEISEVLTAGRPEVGVAPGAEPKTVIYSGTEKKLRNPGTLWDAGDLDTGAFPGPAIRVDFVTPTRLKYGEHLSGAPEFHILLRNLLRRLSLLFYFHCGEDLRVDYRSLIEKAHEVKASESTLRWIDWERYSNRQETKMKMGGFVGAVRYEGGLGPFLPFLAAGETIHVGKGTSFGLGKYHIKSD